MKWGSNIHCYDHFRDLGYSAELTGTKNSNGKDYYEVSFTKTASSTVKQYFDTQNFLLCRQTSVLATPQGSGEQSMELSDYKDFDGYLVYTRLLQSYMGMTTEFTLDRFIVDSGVEDKIFSKPQGK